ncbi:MAG TPA: helix-turn-helix transcriptional regulator [Streptosporangiaceae bacterium]|jgi:transcriptional regulator with XRE-family HTH domain
MADDAHGATVAKRRLSRRLLQLRVQSGYTANHVCDMLNWGRGKVGRFEANQWKRPEMSDIRDLLRVYDVTDSEREELEEIAILARARPWWRDYPEIFANEFPGFENDAIRIRMFMALVLPGLFQTPDYMEAIMLAGARPPAWRRKATESRKRRQEILTRSDHPSPEVNAVITEASLRYRWGSRADRREQIEHLIAVSEQPNVRLRIQRFADGLPRGVFTSASIFDFADSEPSLVFTETDYALLEVSDQEEVRSYIDAFGLAADAALDPADTTTYLRYLAEELE